MKCKHIALVASSCALSFGLFACGDDVINVENKDVYTTVENIGDIDCTEENDGNMAFEKSSATMYVCSEGKWVTMSAQEAIQQRCSAETLKDSTGYKIICDGQTIATITNGKDGAAGTAGTAGESGTAGEKGDTGAKGDGVDADSVVKAVYDKAFETITDTVSKTMNTTVNEKVGASMSSASAAISEELLEKLSCKVADTKTDEGKGIMTVTVACGDATSDIELPVIIPNKELEENLAKVYTKEVFLRYPIVCADEYAFMNNNSALATSAEVNVREVDDKFQATGKGFASDMILKMDPNGFASYNSLTGNEGDQCVKAIRMTGEFKLTNMMNSYAMVSAMVDVSSMLPFMQNSSSTRMTYHALVDMDASDTIVLDFLSDFKAARIEKLLEDGLSFEEASKKANAELAVSMALDENAKAFDQSISSKISDEEMVASIYVPSFFLSAGYREHSEYTYLEIYKGYRNIFAENGNFNKPLDLNISMDPGPTCGSSVHGYDNEPARYFVDFLYNVMGFEGLKLFQKGFIDAYGLPACSDRVEGAFYVEWENTYRYVVDGSEGYFKAFKCNPEAELWSPTWAIAGLMSDDARIRIKETCNEANLDKVVNVTLLGYDYSFKCYSYTDNEGKEKYEWNYLYSGSCEGRKEGDFFVGSGNCTGCTATYMCVEAEDKEGNPTLEPVRLSAVEAYNKMLCTADTKDTLYIDGENGLYYACVHEQNDDVDYYKFVQLGYWAGSCSSGNIDNCYFDADENDYNLLAEIQVGKCTEENEGATFDIFISPVRKETKEVKCSKGHWVVSDYDYDSKYYVSKVLGKCDASVEKLGKIYKLDKTEIDFSGAVGYKAYYKCGHSEGQNGTYYYWQQADELEGKLNKICSKANFDEVASLDGVDYICTESGWVVDNVENYCEVNSEWVYEDLSLSYNRKCQYKGDNYVGKTADCSSSAAWYNGEEACEEMFGKCGDPNASSSASSCIFTYDVEYDGQTQETTLKNEFYACKDSKWTAVDEDGYCAAFVRGNKGRDPNNGDECSINSSASVYLEGNWIDESEIDGRCTYSATEGGSMEIPEDYICLNFGDNQKEFYYAFSKEKSKWVEVSGAEACAIGYPDAKVGDGCDAGGGLVKVTSGKWLEIGSVEAICSYKFRQYCLENNIDADKIADGYVCPVNSVSTMTHVFDENEGKFVVSAEKTCERKFLRPGYGKVCNEVKEVVLVYSYNKEWENEKSVDATCTRQVVENGVGSASSSAPDGYICPIGDKLYTLEAYTGSNENDVRHKWVETTYTDFCRNRLPYNCYARINSNDYSLIEKKYGTDEWDVFESYESWCTRVHGECNEDKFKTGAACSDYPFRLSDNELDIPYCTREEDYDHPEQGDCETYDDDECVQYEEVYPYVYSWFKPA